MNFPSHVLLGTEAEESYRSAVIRIQLLYLSRRIFGKALLSFSWKDDGDKRNAQLSIIISTHTYGAAFSHAHPTSQRKSVAFLRFISFLAHTTSLKQEQSRLLPSFAYSVDTIYHRKMLQKRYLRIPW